MDVKGYSVAMVTYVLSCSSRCMFINIREY